MSDIKQWTAEDGTVLRGRLAGAPSSDTRPVICLPGLTRNGRDFETLVERLTGGPRPRSVFAMDFRGRGLSDHADPESYRPDVEAADVIAVLDGLGWSRPAYVGTSRGGIVTMLLAAIHPDRVGPVVLNDIGPAVPVSSLVAIRDRMTAMIGEVPTDWPGAAEAVRAEFAGAFTALSGDDWLRLAKRYYKADGDGRPRLDYDPRLLDAFASFDPEQGIPTFWPLFDALAPRPVLTLRGENSRLLPEETLAEMARHIPAMAIHRVPDEGHAPLLDDEPTIERILTFLDDAEEAMEGLENQMMAGSEP